MGGLAHALGDLLVVRQVVERLQEAGADAGALPGLRELLDLALERRVGDRQRLLESREHRVELVERRDGHALHLHRRIGFVSSVDRPY